MSAPRAHLAAYALVVSLASARGARAQIPPSIEFRVPKPPTVMVTDSGGIVGYELHVTNLTATTMVLRRVDVVDGGPGARSLEVMSDSVLRAAISRPGLPARSPDSVRTKIDAGMRAIVYLWFHVDAARPPSALLHRLTFQRATGDSALQVLEGAQIPVQRTAVAISPPFQGEWVTINGPSSTSGHRRLVLALNGSVASGQRFAIDYLRVDENGTSFKGDSTKNSSYYAYGTEIRAVADGIVVETKDSIPENVPRAGTRAVAITLVTVAGNHIVVDIGQGHFAFFAHLQPGSLRVHVGDHVTRGQVIGLLGNSGNSTEPHLHFHVSDALASGTSTLGSEGIPYAFPAFEVVAHCTLTRRIVCPRSAPVTVRQGMPLENEMVRIPR